MNDTLAQQDPEVAAIIGHEEERQQHQLSLIPSENFFSPAVREAVGSVVMHKYSEGNIGARYYEGNQYIDELEQLTITRARTVFRLPADWDVNVQALSGSAANLAVYLAVLLPGDTMLGMYLPDGGHLSHGWSYEPGHPADPKKPLYEGGSRRVNISSKMFRALQYKTNPKTQLLDYEALAKIARTHKPKLIITGGTAYTRLIDHARVRKIADSVGALYMADIAHEAGLVAARVIPSPVGIAHIVTMTTHKTLRSGRGAIILAHRDIIKKVNRAVLPGLQGGPFNHSIAGICVGLGEALTPAYKAYAKAVIANAKTLGKELTKEGFSLVTGGTDKHLLLIDLSEKPLLGKKFAKALDYAGMVANFNTMPQETRSPADPSALRLGTPWVTTRGMGTREMQKIAKWMSEVMTIGSSWADSPFDVFADHCRQSAELSTIASEVQTLCDKFPLALKAKVSSKALTRSVRATR